MRGRAAIRQVGRNTLRRLGFEVHRYPHYESLAYAIRFAFNMLHVDCVIDVGANQGQYGRFLRGLGYKGQIISFEPVIDSYAALQRIAMQDGNWEAHHLALGSREGGQVINVTRSSAHSSFLEPNAYHHDMFPNDAQVVATETVPMSTIDAVLGSVVKEPHHRRIFLKMDTQGFDMDVLRGATASVHDLIGLQSELAVKSIYHGMTSYLDALRYMTELGFYLAGIFPTSRDYRDFSLIEVDCVMLRSHEKRSFT